MVYVISFEGKALMPTSNAKARKLLKQKKAKVKNLKPFTIQLTYKTETEYTQNITLGIDSGYRYIGYSAVTDKEELISGELTLLDGQKDKAAAFACWRYEIYFFKRQDKRRNCKTESGYSYGRAHSYS